MSSSLLSLFPQIDARTIEMIERWKNQEGQKIEGKSRLKNLGTIEKKEHIKKVP
jgi:predicted aconitase with swiveling domain